MGDIYRLAAETFVYLGKSERRWDVFDSDISNTAWQSVLERPWFTRTWVIQELMLSRKVVIVIENQHIPWLELVSLCDARQLSTPPLMSMRAESAHEYGMRPSKVYQNHDGEADGDDVLDAISGASIRRPRIAMGPSSSSAKTRPVLDDNETEFIRSLPKGSGRIDYNYWRLPDMMHKTRDFQCSDPRDKLFALLPLFVQPIPKLLYPDYSKGVSDVYADLSWFFIQQNLPNCLAAAGNPSNGETPSWATDWSTPATHGLLSQMNLNDAQRAGFKPGRRDIRASRSGRDKLMLRGVIVEPLGTQHEKTCAFDLGKQHSKLAARSVVEVKMSLDSKRVTSSWTNLFRPVGTLTCSYGSWFDYSGLPASPSELDEHLLESSSVGKDIALLLGQIAKALKGFGGSITLDHTSVGHSSPTLYATYRSAEKCASAFDICVQQLCTFDSTSGTGYLFDASGVRVGELTRNRWEICHTPRMGIGVVPSTALPGDYLCILLGFPSPFILRKTGLMWQVVGECYFDRLAGGELVDKMDLDRVWEIAHPGELMDFTVC